MPIYEAAMNPKSLTATFAPATPDKHIRSGTYLLSSSTPSSTKNSTTLQRTPSSNGLSTLDPMTTPVTDRATTPAAESINGEGEWSSAVGRASVAGKSGRVIERLMGEVDKLKRELNLAQARVEEEQLRSVSAREALDSLRGTKDNLEAICETNRNIISRRDRKIEELRTDLDKERSQRSEAETSRNELSVEIQTLRRDCEREMLRASEVAARANAEYETFKKALSRMKIEWDKQMGQMRKELDVVQQDRDSERYRLRTLGNVCEQLRAESFRTTSSYDHLSKEYNLYRSQMDEALSKMRAKISEGHTANEELHSDLKKVLGEMNWVINVQKNVNLRHHSDSIPGG